MSFLKCHSGLDPETFKLYNVVYSLKIIVLKATNPYRLHDLPAKEMRQQSICDNPWNLSADRQVCGLFFNTESTEFFLSQSYTENIRGFLTTADTAKFAIKIYSWLNKYFENTLLSFRFFTGFLFQRKTEFFLFFIRIGNEYISFFYIAV